MCKCSIIIPIYNTEKYLPYCLDSVLRQTEKDIEIICVNDGSTDNSLNILTIYSKKDTRIIVINQKNTGLSGARNAGIAKSKGKYLYFLDSDDYIADTAISILHEKATSNDADIVYFSGETFFNNRETEKKFSYSKNDLMRLGFYPDKYDGVTLFSMFNQNHDFLSSVCIQYIKREFLSTQNIYFYNKILHEDELFTFISILSAKCVVCINEKLFYRRMRLESIMTSHVTHKNFIGLFLCYSNMLLFLNKNNINSKSVIDYVNRFFLFTKKKFCLLSKTEQYYSIKKIENLHPFEQILFNNSINTDDKNIISLCVHPIKIFIWHIQKIFKLYNLKKRLYIFQKKYFKI